MGCPDPLGELTALPRPSIAGSWGREGKGEIKGQEGREWNGEKGRGRRRGGEGMRREGEGYPPSE